MTVWKFSVVNKNKFVRISISFNRRHFCFTIVNQAPKLDKKYFVTVLSIKVKTFTSNPIVFGLGVIDLKGSKFKSQHITDLPTKVY